MEHDRHRSGDLDHDGQEGDERALAEVVHAHLPPIERMARGYAASPHVERLELEQDGVAESRVRDIERRALAKLRRAAARAGAAR